MKHDPPKFLQDFGAHIVVHQPQGGDDQFLAAMFFPQWNVLVRNIRGSETVIENMNENITQ